MLYSGKERELIEEVKKILDKGIEEVPGKSLLLIAIIKKLEELRDRFEVHAGLDPLASQSSTAKPWLRLDNITEIYISLYQSHGSNLQKWQEVLAALVHSSMGRPIYKNEKDVSAATHLSDRNPNNAYIVLKVNEAAILPDSQEQPRVDREGRKLIMLKEGAITLHNMVCLVHASGVYKLVGNFLVKQP